MLRLTLLFLVILNEHAFGAPGSFSGNVDATDPDSAYGDANIFAGAILLLLIYGLSKFAQSLGLLEFLNAEWMNPLWSVLLICVAVFMALQVLGLLLLILYWVYEWWWFFLPLGLYLAFKSRRPVQPPLPPASP